MSRIYTVEFENVSVTAAQDFFEISPATNKPCRIIGLTLEQGSDVGDAQEEMLRVSVVRVPATATSGSGGTAPTPRALDATNQAAGFTAEVNNTTVATTSGTLERLITRQFNIRTGLEMFLPPEMRPQFVNGTLGVVRLHAAPADALSMSGTLFVEEEG
jgi:hypothetical protein